MNNTSSNSSMQQPQQTAQASQQQQTSFQHSQSPQQTNHMSQPPAPQATTPADYLDQQVRTRSQQNNMNSNMNPMAMSAPMHSQQQQQQIHQQQQLHHQMPHHQQAQQQQPQQQPQQQQASHHNIPAHHQQQSQQMLQQSQQQASADQQHFNAMGQADNSSVNSGVQQGGRVTRQRQRLPTYNPNPLGGTMEDQVRPRHSGNMPPASASLTVGESPNIAAITAASMASMHQNQGANPHQGHPLAAANTQNQHPLAAMSGLAPHQQTQAPHHMVNPHAQHNPNPAAAHHLPRMMPQTQQPQGAQPVLHPQVSGALGVADYVPSAEPSHICPVCHDAFGDEQSLARHAARSHSQNSSQRSEPLHCNQCTATLANPQNLRRHMAVCHSGERTGPLRRGSTGSVNKVNNPNRKPKTAKVFVCSLCPTGTTFRWKGNLKRHHQLIHLQAKPYKCDICNEAFGTKSNREVHMIVHLPEKRDLAVARNANVQSAPVTTMASQAVGMPGPGMASGPGMNAVGTMGASMQGNHHNAQQAPPGMPPGVGGMGMPHAMTGIPGMPSMGTMPNQTPQHHPGHQLPEHDPHAIKYER